MTPAPSGRTRWVPVHRRNASWSGLTTVNHLQAADLPTAAVVRTRIAEAIEEFGSRAQTLRPVQASTGRTGVLSREDLRACVEAMVIEGVGRPEPSQAVAEARSNEAALEAVPFRYVVGPGWATFHFNHAMGDWSSNTPLISHLVDPTGSSPFPGGRPTGWAPVAAALARTFGRSPTALREVLRLHRDPLPPLGTQCPDVLRPITVAGRLSGQVLQLADQVPRSTGFAAWFATRALAAARRVGIELYPGVALAIDCRRYCGREVEGNFSSGTYFGVSDDVTPSRLSHEIKEAVRCGRPLLSMTNSMVRAGAVAAPRVGGDAPGLLSLSHTVWRAADPGFGDPPVLVRSTAPANEAGISIASTRVGHHIAVGVTHFGRWEDEVMLAFVETLTGGAAL